MRILLIVPPTSPLTITADEFSLYEPLALEYLGAAVRSDHDVRFLDMRIDADLQGVLDDFGPDIVGITAYTVHVKTVKALFERIRRWNPETLTVVGGHHATVAAEDFLVPAIDVIVQGEGVEPFREIVARHERAEAFEGIPGTVVPGPEGPVRTEPGPVDLDAIPPPDRTLTASYRSHYRCDWMRPLASMRTSKGCPHRCRFCALWRIAQKRYLKRSPEAIVEEIAGIDEECIFFADDESLVVPKRMMEVARQIKEAGIRKRFFCYGRSDTIAHNPDLLEAWKDVGLERIFVGLEFAKDDDLGYIRKGSTASDNDEAVRILHDLDIEIYASLIVRPEFTRDDFRELSAYCRHLALSYVGFTLLTPLPGTEFHEEVHELLLTHDTDYYDFIHTVLPTTLPLEDFYAEYTNLYRTATTVPRKLGFLARHRWREIPSVIDRSERLLHRMRKAYRDYPAA